MKRTQCQGYDNMYGKRISFVRFYLSRFDIQSTYFPSEGKGRKRWLLCAHYLPVCVVSVVCVAKPMTNMNCFELPTAHVAFLFDSDSWHNPGWWMGCHWLDLHPKDRCDADLMALNPTLKWSRSFESDGHERADKFPHPFTWQTFVWNPG